MTPKLSEIYLSDIPWQEQAFNEIYSWDYNTKGTLEVLLSGSVGSAKSVFLSYIILRMAVENPGMQIGIGRKSLKDLKETLFATILEMGDQLYDRGAYNKTTMSLELLNTSKIKSFSWADSNYKKVRSYQFDAFFIEELTETDHMNHYEEIKMRVGREPNGRPKLVMSATNPDDPSHPAYNYFIMSDLENRKVFYSKTKDNKFLAPTYIDDLERNLSPKMKRRMLDGEWLEITGGNTIYYSYDPEFNFKKHPYTINPRLPIYCSWDFNVGVGKPMSMSISQYDKQTDTFHFFDEIVIEGIRTLDTCEELAARGYLDLNQLIVVTGDATGRSNSPNSKHTNYEIIEEFIANYKTKDGKRVYYNIDLPSKNPPIRTRHETVNAYICNSKMERRLFLYEKCKTLDEGLRLTKLKANADYIEDDSKPWQHITTSIGYNVCQVVAKLNYQSTPQLFKR